MSAVITIIISEGKPLHKHSVSSASRLPLGNLVPHCEKGGLGGYSAPYSVSEGGYHLLLLLIKIIYISHFNVIEEKTQLMIQHMVNCTLYPLV